MGFLAPWFLLGLGSLALPVYLHLLKRDVAERVTFSSLMFFERSRQSSVKHRKIDYRLLLAGRLLLLLLLVLAFANPFLNVDAGGGEASLRLVVVDNSPSMAAGGNFEKAKREGAALLASLPKGGRLQGASFDNRLRTPADLASLTISDARGSLGEFAQALRALGAEERGRVEVHYFSDFQKSSSPDGFAELRLPENVSLVAHKLAAPATQNWLVEQVKAQR
ncbi:MAG: BatA domain-containing protein, partial [Bryobacteraceae bacterium]|nr:BatA domain-containing protein [Bryobacteraceae bacterium]